MLALYVSVARNPQNDYTLLHRPMLWVNGALVPTNFATHELLECLKSAGFEDDMIDRGQAELLERARLRSNPTRSVLRSLRGSAS